MTADPNDIKGPQQVPATDIAAIIPVAAHAAIAQIVTTIANIWHDASGHRGKGRPEELSDIPPASMRHMATVLKRYAGQLDSAGVVPDGPGAVQAAVEAEANAIVEAAIAQPPSEPREPDGSTPANFVPAVMAEIGPFGPPGAYVEIDGDETWAVYPASPPAFGPPAPWVDDDGVEGTEVPKA